jgi:hypothetical protein
MILDQATQAYLCLMHNIDETDIGSVTIEFCSIF